MSRFDLLVSYDIADNRRLVKVAKLLEKYGIRVQYSIFLIVECDAAFQKNLQEELLELIDPETDDVRIYRIEGPGITLGCAVALDDPFSVV